MSWYKDKLMNEYGLTAKEPDNCTDAKSCVSTTEETDFLATDKTPISRGAINSVCTPKKRGRKPGSITKKSTVKDVKTAVTETKADSEFLWEIMGCLHFCNHTLLKSAVNAEGLSEKEMLKAVKMVTETQNKVIDKINKDIIGI
jgi:hypothetical protein